MQEPVPGISAVPDESNARYFHVVVAGKSRHRFFKHFLAFGAGLPDGIVSNQNF
jgi:hypothetical protein